MPIGLPRPLVATIKLIAALPVAPVLVALGCRERLESRRRAGQRPRLVWGPVPLISLKYWSSAMRRLGYESVTCVEPVYDINAREDFDRHRADFGPPGLWFEPWRDFIVFAWALRSADVFMLSFDGGFLRYTALRWLEAPLLRLAGKRIVVSPYGGDIAMPGYMGVWEEAMARDYPQTAARAPLVRRTVDHLTNWADVVIRNVNPGYQPRHDVLWPNQFAIDTDEWAPTCRKRAHDGTDGPVVVLHAPNHRVLKGTAELIAAVDELRAEGLKIELQLLERRPNAEVRDALASADILAEQFLAGYAMLAVEGLATATPVLAHMSWLPQELLEHPAVRECPIVDTSIDSLKDNLRALVTDPERRRELGAESRAFAVRRHSYDALGRVWAAIVDAAWTGRPVAPAVALRGEVAR